MNGEEERTAEREQDDIDRKRGEDILDAVEASARGAEKPHPLLEAIALAYRERGEQE